MNKPVILCVDDEKIVLDSLKKDLQKSFNNSFSIETTESGADALDIIKDNIIQNIETPIIISDWLMPNMKGDEFLILAHKLLPDTIKIMLTGQVTTDGLGNAINNAKLYRFIPKPWNSDDFDLTVTEALKSYYNRIQVRNLNSKLIEFNNNLEDLVKKRTIELNEIHKVNQELLEHTLNGSVNALITILMKSQPKIFGKALRMRNYAKHFIADLGIDNMWEIDIACLFSQIGILYLGDSMLAKYLTKEKFVALEQISFIKHPQKTHNLIIRIPKFENIANGILNHLKDIQLLTTPGSYYISVILRICSDLDDLVQSGLSEYNSFQIIMGNKELYDKEILKKLIIEKKENDIDIELEKLAEILPDIAKDLYHNTKKI